jgi:polar amino acid transport system substrate-binding protein
VGKIKQDKLYNVVGKDKYLLKHADEVVRFKRNMKELFNAIILTKLYLNDPVEIRKIVFFKYPKFKFLRIGITTTWPPFNFMENKELKGISVDLWNLIAKKAHLDFNYKIEPFFKRSLDDLKNKKIDIIPNSNITEKDNFAIASKSYISFPFAIVCKRDYKYISQINSFAVGKSFTAYKMMKKYYPDKKYLLVKDSFEAIDKVLDDKVECAVDILPVMAWILNKKHYKDLRITKLTPFKFELQVLLRKDLFYLKPIIDHAIDSISKEEKREIVNRYIGQINIIHRNDNKTIIGIFILVLIFVSVISLFKILKYKNKAYKDKLTNINNRMALDKELNKIKKGSIIYFDIDFFKKINDKYGHDMGDYVLKEISKLVAENIRSNDIFGRWGGEEFLIILPNTPFESALKVAEKIRKVVENYNFKGINVTISLGVSEIIENEQIEYAIKRADEALYEAKKSGRNQVKGKK